MDFNPKAYQEKARTHLLPILRCVSCGSGTLKLTAGEYKGKTSFPLFPEHLHCETCGANYPITNTYIPVLWTPSLKEQLTDTPDTTSNIGANIQVYDSISDDYQSYTRTIPDNALRIHYGVKQILAAQALGQKYHLDFGCGPGKVLGWLADFDLISIGMDVSLVNLRNAQRLTDAVVICGDATNMPFIENSFDLITEASVLHHILDYQSAIKEACRVCRPSGGIILDAEPSTDTMAFSKLAVTVFDLRFPVYKLLSYFQPDKYIFRDTEQAKLNLLAEIHHQPGKGFPLVTIQELFNQAGFEVTIIPAPTPTLESRAKPNWQSIVLNLLSFRNPWNPKFSPFTAITIPPSKNL